jgi:dynein heavy chain
LLQYVGQASQQYLETYRRYNYTTPKSYLELISLYKTLLARKRAELQAAKERLQNGVEKIAQASAQVRVLGWSFVRAPVQLHSHNWD